MWVLKPKQRRDQKSHVLNVIIVWSLHYCYLISHLIHMFRYMSSIPTHIHPVMNKMSVNENWWGVSTNYVHSGSRAYLGSESIIVPVLPQNPPLGKQEWVLLYAYQECYRSRGASTPHQNTWRPTGRPKDFNYTTSYTTINTITNWYPPVFPIPMQIVWLLQIDYNYQFTGSNMSIKQEEQAEVIHE